MHWHRLCLSELLKFVSKLELVFYEEVAGLREEKTALFGQGHWKVLTGKKSCKQSSTHLTVLHKKKCLKTLFLPLTAGSFRASVKSASKRSLFHYLLLHHCPGYLFPGNYQMESLSLLDIWDVTKWYRRGYRCLLQGKATSGCVAAACPQCPGTEGKRSRAKKSSQRLKVASVFSSGRISPCRQILWHWNI